MSEFDTCGLFGKLPMQSDFISHFLPESFTQYWHGWLQSCLSVSQEQLGDHWRECYLTAPIWRFAIMPGVMHEAGAVGVVIPSVDEVGRFFPLTIVHLGPHRPWNALLTGAQWFDKAEYTALLALEDDISYSTYMGYFERMAIPEFDCWPELDQQVVVSHVNKNSAIFGLDLPQSPSHSQYLLHSLHQRLYGDYSLWWTDGSEQVSPCSLVCSGLPDSGQFSAMLDGNWQEWHWAIESVITGNN